MSDISASMSAFGFASVIVTTRRPGRAAGPRRSQAEAPWPEAGAAAAELTRLGEHFVAFEASSLSQSNAQLAARRDSSAGEGASAELAAPVSAGPVPPAPIAYVEFPHLGVVYGTVDRAGLAALRADPEVARIGGAPAISLVRPESKDTASGSAGRSWGLDAMGIPALWAAGLTGAGVRVAHLDTGVDAAHPALEGAIAGFAAIDDTGRVISGAQAADSDDHGTHTAAILAGRAVGKRVVGVAPGAELYAAQVIEGGDTLARVLGGLNWALGNGVSVVSLSLGLRGYRTDLLGIFELLRDSGVLPVVAVGNEGAGTSRSPGNYPKALSVGYHDRHGAVAQRSSSQRFARRSQPVVPDIVAPGVDIASAAPGGKWQVMSGSSMAVPHVAGLAALLLEAKPTLTVRQLESAIIASAHGVMDPERAGKGAVDGPRALARVQR